MASFQDKIGWKMPRKREYKIIVPFRSYPMRNRKFQKNSKKIKKIPLWLHFEPKKGWKLRRKRRNKNYRYV